MAFLIIWKKKVTNLQFEGIVNLMKQTVFKVSSFVGNPVFKNKIKRYF